jgi:hypothetical protein
MARNQSFITLLLGGSETGLNLKSLGGAETGLIPNSLS